MLTRFIRTQLIVFAVLTVIALVVLGWYFLRLPTLAGVGQYTLKADLPSSGGLYRTANVTYRGVTIGRVTNVEPTDTGVRATMSIGNEFKIPVNTVANVHSVSAVGEQYLDLVSDGSTGKIPQQRPDDHQGHRAPRDRSRPRRRQQRGSRRCRPTRSRCC